ncbi:EH signature domain-containing protein [Minwuia thermotolerans]|nr:EH signature domain-containing protein [Minwuia thermotolerans]
MNKETHLSEVLLDSVRRTVALPRIASEPVAVNRAAKAIRDRWPDVAGRDLPGDPEDIVRGLLARIERDDWRDCYWSDLCDGIRAIGDTRKSFWKQTQYRPVLDLLFQEVRRGEQPIFIAAAARAYVDSWDRDSTFTVELGHRLLQRKTVPQDWFHELATTYALFNPDEVVGRLRAALIESDSPYETIRGLGMPAPHGLSLMQEVHRDFIRHLDRRLQAGDVEAYRLLLDWIAPEGREPMLTGAGEAIAAMLTPWIEQEPPAEVRDLLEHRLVEAFQDPRILRAGAWGACSRISERASDVMLRWLTGKTIRTFFRIIDQVAGSHMWKDRGPFWLDRLEKGYIQEAWFALSPLGETVANRLDAESRGEISLAWAENKSRNSSDKEKCLLFVKDSGLWIVEGSHNFKVHIFSRDSGDPVAPYQEAYDCDEIRRTQRDRRNVEAIVHRGPWQYKVGRRIAEWSK